VPRTEDFLVDFDSKFSFSEVWMMPKDASTLGKIYELHPAYILYASDWLYCGKDIRHRAATGTSGHRASTKERIGGEAAFAAYTFFASTTHQPVARGQRSRSAGVRATVVRAGQRLYKPCLVVA